MWLVDSVLVIAVAYFMVVAVVGVIYVAFMAVMLVYFIFREATKEPHEREWR